MITIIDTIPTILLIVRSIKKKCYPTEENKLKYFNNHSLKKLENIALNEATGKALQKIVREYAAYHLDASNIKSESMI